MVPKHTGLCAVFLFCVTISRCYRLVQCDPDFLRRLQDLENAERQNRAEIQSLRDTVENQRNIVTELTRELADSKEKLQKIEEKATVSEKHNKGRPFDLSRNTGNNLKRLVLDSAVPRRIGFTAYLSDGISLVDEQIVPFNTSVTNEGSGFDETSGIFTCPPGGDGVYLFTFVISAAGAQDSVGAMLTVDGVDAVGALVETFQQGQDSQGGNQAVIRLKAGDRVWVRQTYGRYIASSETFRGTSFSGVLLFS